MTFSSRNRPASGSRPCFGARTIRLAGDSLPQRRALARRVAAARNQRNVAPGATNRGWARAGPSPAAAYRTMSVSASEGDLLVLFSDGITEAPNRREEQFGDDRLIAVVQRAADSPAPAISKAILDAVRAFAGDRAAAR